MPLHPMPLVRIPNPFDHDQFIYELKHNGFRALAVIRGHHCELVSRRGHVYKFHQLAEELAHAVRAADAILDGEIVCLGPDGRSLFNPLLFRRDWPNFIAFDLFQAVCRADLEGVVAKWKHGPTTPMGSPHPR